MKRIPNPFRQPLDRMQRRFVRWRPGSVLILVVALLVLMALIGTAYITMAQSDRYAAQQHTYNTQIDLLVESVVNLAKGVFTRDMFDANGHFKSAGTFNNYTGVGMDDTAAATLSPSLGYKPNVGNWWLGDRLPSIDPTQALGTAGSNVVLNNLPHWRFITGPLTGSTFESPLWPTGSPQVYSRDLPLGTTGGGMNARWVPTFLTVNGTNYPALTMVDASGRILPGAGFTFLAGDADGDGIADSALFRLPIGAINGLTYYAGVRIIDNSAAVNVNTAWAPDDPGNPQLAALNVNNTFAFAPNNFFPSNINLFSLIDPNPVGTAAADSIGNWNAYRYGFNGPPNPATVLPADENGTARRDFAFSSLPEEVWIQMGRRLQNPGLLAPGNTAQYQAAGLTESMALAQRFILRNPTRVTSIVENALPNSTLNLSPFEPYTPGLVNSWFQQNFFFRYPTSANATLSNTNPSMPIRAVLTARNPQSSFVPSKFHVGQTGTSTYAFGDMITQTMAPQGNSRAFVYIGPSFLVPQQMPVNAPLSKLFWAAEPYVSAPTKISINSGSFEQLFTAFWSAMFQPGANNTTTFATPPNTERRQFYSPLRDPNELPFGGTPRQFRPSDQIALLPPSEVVKLRAAIAAVNTLNLRNGFSVNSHRILLNAFLGTIPTGSLPPGANSVVEATIYGASPQPFITRVYADNDTQSAGSNGGTQTGQNPTGYVGIELYNPYPFAIDISNWQLGVLKGRVAGNSATTAGTYPNMNLVPISGFTGFHGTPNATVPTTVIPGNGYLVIDNAPDPGGVQGAVDAFYPPPIISWTSPQNTPPNGTLPRPTHYMVPNLSQVLGATIPNSGTSTPAAGELVLLRPHTAMLSPANTTAAQIAWPTATGAGGVVSYQPSAVAGEYNETQTPLLLSDFVPVDSFDFSGMTVASSTTGGGGGGGQFTGIYYARSQRGKWQFAYPGHWDPTTSHPWGGMSAFRQEGTISPLPWQANQRAAANWGVTPLPFGSPAGTGTDPCTFPATDRFLPIQLNNWTFPGPYPMSQGVGNRFPFGAFARNADILQVPYVGAYRLRLLQNAPGQNDTALNYKFPPIPGSSDTVLELNSTPMDLQQADDYDTYLTTGSDDVAENIGRFTPIDHRDLPANSPVDDFHALPSNSNFPFYQGWRYHWAMQVLDYLTVESPQDAQIPAVDAQQYPPLISPLGPFSAPPQGINHTSFLQPAPQSYGLVDIAGGLSPQVRGDFNTQANYTNAWVLFLDGPAQGRYFQIVTLTHQNALGQFVWRMTLRPLVLTGSPTPTTALPPARGNRFVILSAPEETAPLDGLVNVNTASWRVLAAVPFVPNSSSPNGTAGQLNATIAWNIVKYRDVNDGTANPPHGHGPFQNLFELNEVPITLPSGQVMPFRDIVRQQLNGAQTGDFSMVDGDLSPPTGLDGVIGDFEGTFLAMNRISNLLTTRSDSFTVYVIVQGWRDAETRNPTLAVQRRAAFLVDRSVVTPLNPTPSFTPVPAD